MSSGSPRASVIVATYNRAERLARCLDMLAKQTAAPADFEVVVVADGSTDGTREVLASFLAPFTLRALVQPNQGQPAALNRGAAEAEGAFLIFLDDDILVSAGFVEAHLALLSHDPSAVGVGQMLLVPAPESDWFTRAFGETWRRHYERLNTAPASVTWRDCFGGSMSLSRETFLRAGGFALDLARGYDLELAARLAADGCRFVYLPHATGSQDERKDFRSLLRDAELGGEGSVGIFRRHSEALSLIAHFPEQTPQAAVALRLLIRLDLSPTALARLLWWAPRFDSGQLAFSLVHRYAFWRGVKRALDDPGAWEHLSHGVVILMYHGFCQPGERAARYLMPIARFAGQMQLLKRRGYRGLDVETYIALRRSNTLPSDRWVVITFDDGYAELSTIVPVLQRPGFGATVFLPTARAGEVNDWDPGSELYGRRVLTWAEAGELRDRGLRLGAHSRTHRDLRLLDDEALAEEIDGPQDDFERQTGETVAAFSYPYGEYRPEYAPRLANAGYSAGLTVDPGPNTLLTDLYAIRRVEVRGTDTLLEFAYTMATGRELRAAWRRAALLSRCAASALGSRLRNVLRPRRSASMTFTEKS